MNPNPPLPPPPPPAPAPALAPRLAPRLRTALAIAAASAISLSLPGCASKDTPTPDRPAVQAIPSKGGNLVAEPQPADPTTKSENAEPEPLLLPTSGRVHNINAGLQFVVVDYTLGGAPPLQSLVHVYRGNQRVGQLRLTGPERNGFIAADIVEGILQVDDEVRIH
ncbi:MAG: hypothetical protein AB7O66_10040 [Limisphaerales bacterium]